MGAVKVNNYCTETLRLEWGMVELRKKSWRVYMEWMMNEWVNKTSKRFPDYMAPQEIEKVIRFHRSIPNYVQTPLHDLSELATHLNVEKIWVKDESYRFDLNAFKVLGGVYAVGCYLAKKLGLSMDDMSFESLSTPEARKKLGVITFYTATDGNHGHGVAWAAKCFGHKAVVFMPKGSAISRLERIRKEGAEATITRLNYDDAVRLATEKAKKTGGVLVQDTAFEGYESIPMWIMQGYGSIMHEIMGELKQRKDAVPTHVFLQAGVGSFAGAMLGYLVTTFGSQLPVTTIIEPKAADCLYQSVKNGDGTPKAVTGDLETIMAGLACGEPNTVSWEILRDYGHCFVSCDDHLSAEGMRILSSPIGKDPRIVSGESGSVGIGLLRRIREDLTYGGLAIALGINSGSRILVISTEGDTDPEGYKRIVWDGINGLVTEA